jgi:hypothetical protein
MKPWTINLINAIVLIAFGAWGYFSADKPSTTALIPVAFGLVFAASTPLFKRGNRVVVHIVVLLTVLLLIALIMPLRGAIEDGRTMGIVRVAIMLATCLVASVIYVKSFIDARKARKGQ